MDEIIRTIEEEMEVFENPLALCAEQPVIEASSFADLALVLSEKDGVTSSETEIYDLCVAQTKRFVACGGNYGEKFGVIRKNKKNGWQYFIDMITV